MLLKNCNIIFLDKIEKGSILIENGIIKEINPNTTSSDSVIDCKGLYVAPGFIDIHIHGAGGYDTMDGTFDAINEISKTICKYGTTSFTPTTMTMSAEDILKSMTAIKKAKLEGTDGAQVLGAHLEGPFISPNAIGAQNPNYLIKPTFENFESMTGDAMDSVVSITMAPEVDGAKELASILTEKGIRCSIGHTKATYEEAIEGIKCGFCHSTHLFNAMTGFTHRVTDAMCACGMPDGNYALGGQPVIVKDGSARLENGALAGSILTLNKAIKNIYENTDYPLYEIVKMASFNGAKYCRVDDKKGQIKENFDADLVLFDDNIDIKMTIVNGKIVYSS